jgi:hypothetical protein
MNAEPGFLKGTPLGQWLAAPLLTWTTPAAIIYGTALSSNQLNATANVPGTFVYNPASGTLLPAGTNTLSVVFNPTDALDYTSATDSVSLVVLPAAPLFQGVTRAVGAVSLTWSTMSGHTYQVQYKTNLTQTNWVSFGGTMLATNSALTASDGTTNSQRFYRVLLLP